MNNILDTLYSAVLRSFTIKLRIRQAVLKTAKILDAKHCYLDSCVSCTKITDYAEQREMIIIKYKTIILSVLLYGCEAWSLTLREECMPGYL